MLPSVVAVCPSCGKEYNNPSEALEAWEEGACLQPGCWAKIEMVWDVSDWTEYSDPNNKWNTDPRI